MQTEQFEEFDEQIEQTESQGEQWVPFSIQ